MVLKFILLSLLTFSFGCTHIKKMSDKLFPAGEKQKVVKKKPARIKYKNKIKLSRYILTTVCYTGKKKCVGPVANKLETANVSLPIKKFNNNNVKGIIAGDSLRFADQGIPIKSEIKITKRSEDKFYKVFFSIKAGSEADEQIASTVFEVKNLNKLGESTLTGHPVEFGNGTLKAELVVGPPLPLEEAPESIKTK